MAKKVPLFIVVGLCQPHKRLTAKGNTYDAQDHWILGVFASFAEADKAVSAYKNWGPLTHAVIEETSVNAFNKSSIVRWYEFDERQKPYASETPPAFKGTTSIIS